jgi:hypothetical protein
MDDERLKNPENIFGKDYFDEQLEIVGIRPHYYHLSTARLFF